MTDIETIREALEAYEELAVDMMDNVCPSMGNDVIRAQNAIRLFDEMAVTEPVARVAGYYGGQCVVEPINPATILPVGVALCYTK